MWRPTTASSATFAIKCRARAWARETLKRRVRLQPLAGQSVDLEINNDGIRRPHKDTHAEHART